jgi:hypothetical protein
LDFFTVTTVTFRVLFLRYRARTPQDSALQRFATSGLLPQSQGGLASGTEENTECTQDGYEELDHELTVVARGADSMPRPAQPLISRSDEVLTKRESRPQEFWHIRPEENLAS